MFPPIFSTNPAQYVTPGGTTVYVALQLAAYFGFKNIIMYGLDYSFKWDQSLAPETNHLESAEGDDNHFIKNYRSGKNWCPPCYKNMATGYTIAENFLSSRGINIYNASRSSQLQVFKRIAFEDALKL